jgi:hypothetical protein
MPTTTTTPTPATNTRVPPADPHRPGQCQPPPPVAVATDPPINLPAQITSFIGREQDLAVVEARLLEANICLVT